MKLATWTVDCRCERKFEIIGEAVRRLEKNDPAIIGSALADDLAPRLRDVEPLSDG